MYIFGTTNRWFVFFHFLHTVAVAHSQHIDPKQKITLAVHLYYLCLGRFFGVAYIAPIWTIFCLLMLQVPTNYFERRELARKQFYVKSADTKHITELGYVSIWSKEELEEKTEYQKVKIDWRRVKYIQGTELAVNRAEVEPEKYIIHEGQVMTPLERAVICRNWKFIEKYRKNNGVSKHNFRLLHSLKSELTLKN